MHPGFFLAPLPVGSFRHSVTWPETPHSCPLRLTVPTVGLQYLISSSACVHVYKVLVRREGGVEEGGRGCGGREGGRRCGLGWKDVKGVNIEWRQGEMSILE